MPAIDVTEICCHGECGRFAKGPPAAPDTCRECGKEQVPTEVQGGKEKRGTVRYVSSERYVAYNE
jgi:hypothetical protein